MITLKTNISLFAFETQPLQAEALSVYEKLFSKYSDSDVKFETFSDVREFFTALSQNVSEAELSVLAIPDSQYIKIKNLLFSALKTPTAENGEILELLEKNGFSDCSEYAVMPKSAEILMSQSGKNCGFIERRGRQTMFFLPLDDTVAAEITPQLQTFLGLVEPVETMQEDENNVEVQNTQNNSSDEHDLPYKVVKLMRERGFSAAVASSRCAPLVFDALLDYEKQDYNDIIYSLDVESEKADMPQNEYIAALAGKARQESDATLGISLSSVGMTPENKNEYFMTLCVADETNARVFKIYSCDGESLENFIHACIHRLYEVLGEYAENAGFIIPPMPADPTTLSLSPEDISSTSKTSRKKAGIIIVLAAIAAILLGLAVTFFVKAYSTKDNNPSSSTETTEDKNILEAFKGSILDIIENTTDGVTEAISSTDALDSTEDSSSTESSSADSTSKVSQTISLSEASSLLTTTTSASVIATRPSTTVTQTTEKVTATESAPVTKPTAKTGTFTFTVYGYGHGVGMSQNGAMVYAKNGWDYKKILMHYYNASGITLVKDADMPETVSFNGKNYPMVEYLAKTTRAEMGASANIEAFKAQVVAIYTYAKRTGFKLNSSHHAFNSTYDYEGTTIHSAVKAVLGEYLAYNGSPAMTPYFSTSAGKTTSSANVWGGSFPYLQGGRTSPETNVVRTLKMTSEELKALVKEYNASAASSSKITLQDDPAKWITILEHDSAVSKNVGYISSIKIGNQTMRGNAFRLNIMGSSTLRSHCFSFTYTPD